MVVAAASIDPPSARKVTAPPVALMFHEGAPRILASGVHIPSLFTADSTRVALEACQLAGGYGPGEVVALGQITAEGSQKFERFLILNALGNKLKAEIMG